MKKARKPLEIVYIHMFGVETVKDGIATVIFAMDSYSEYAFDAVTGLTPKTDDDVFDMLKEIFDNVFKTRRLNHAKVTTFVTSFPPEDFDDVLRQIVPAPHKFIYNSEAAEKAVKPLIDSFMGGSKYKGQ